MLVDDRKLVPHDGIARDRGAMRLAGIHLTREDDLLFQFDRDRVGIVEPKR